MDCFLGPLGTHRNYIGYIAFENHRDYTTLCQRNLEEGNTQSPSKYHEFRLFLNSIESFNNILEYLWFDMESELPFDTIFGFKNKVFELHPILKQCADLANAYKHCVRELNNKGKRERDTNLPWARDLQNPSLPVSIGVTQGHGVKVESEYVFEWPIEEHVNILSETFIFWLNYNQDPNSSLVNA